MWLCTKCREKLDDNFDVCWNCGTSKDGVEDPGFRKADDAPAPAEVPGVDVFTAIRAEPDEIGVENTRVTANPLHCLRCRAAMKFVGTKSFHEGFSWGGILGDWGEFLVNQESFDAYVCTRCGRVEFFVAGIGAELRPRNVDE